MEKNTKTIKVIVNFPAASNPFKQEFEPAETIGSVRTAAMQQFGVDENPSTKYYLAHAGTKLEDSQTIGEVAGHAKAVELTLVKEIVSG